ncbi:hypothetical protein GALL_374210 [mine drainage metagenome]|uniref:Spore protein YkvP/CgeB glycosyl transferase-like domain-containing protein n=1 Tax=mine drainage metagenome TaxID=410659 RepID=A0A1J5QY45_9ZZZZ
MTKVLVVGKGKCLVHMTENTVEAFRQAGCQVDLFALNGSNRAHAFYFKLRGSFAGGAAAVMAESLRQRIRAFQPDLIVFVLGAWPPELIYQAALEAGPGAIRVAWVGDVFGSAESVFAGYMDWIFCTDTYFMDLVREYGFDTPASYLPLALDPSRFYPRDTPRSDKIVYVAKSSPGRAAMVSRIEKPLTLYGRRWRRLHAPQHEIHPHHLSLEKLPEVYASSRAVLNLKNELNVVRGVNQRSFEPYGCKTPVLNDDVEDLPLCLEPGREILVYHSLDELHELHAKLTADPGFARAVGEAGYRRVMAEHTYAHRAHEMLRKVGLE